MCIELAAASHAGQPGRPASPDTEPFTFPGANAGASIVRCIGALLTACALLGAVGAHAAPAEVRTADVDRFFRVYDAARGRPQAEDLQRDYLDPGSEGLQQFIPHRILSAAALAEKVSGSHELYEQARRCARQLPRVEPRLDAAFRRLARMLPDTRFPPVTVLIGRGNSGGTTGPSGVLIGLEVVCSEDTPGQAFEDRLVHLIVHEYGHVQQAPDDANDPARTTVLASSLREGGAELVAKLASGTVSNVHLLHWTRGHEKGIEERFLRDADGNDLKPWLYAGRGTPAEPGDLGYWVGYRICMAYYQRHGRTAAALRHILDLTDPREVLRQSGWRPGIQLANL